ncbi:hypothetical protein HYE60_08150 [Aggregatibacter actinomycetemcomitans]|uniref:hypothetical protein n=1 Tax=Aggregatibacter actinomycetemcomitans TaxID=714 RepID=UPI00197B4016|nr:hypothetical protein [Aggregatibacter actinomycetemcomitans]MBN6075209.1 hypothetical protein [Aggregatibacter actinomycetemcomitans]
MNTPLVKIETDVNPDFLCYDWKISRKSRILSRPVTENHQYKEHVLLSVTRQPLSASKTTQSHGLSTIANDTPTTLYISEIKVYLVKQTNLSNVATFSGIYTLEEIQKGKIHVGDDAVPMFKTTSGTSSQTANHTVNCQISREKRAFFCTSKLTEEDYYQGKCSQDDPFAKTEISNRINSRLINPYPDQELTSLCGPAAFYYCLLKDRPDIYEKAAWALWKYGKVKIGKLNIKPSNACKHVDHLKTPYNSISGLDWLTLASLRDSENNIGKYDEIEDRVAGISFPSDLISWFGKIGCRNIINSTSLYVSRNVDELVELNNFYSSNNNVILFVSANVIEGDEGSNNKEHWICLASNVKVNNENIVSQSLLNKTVKFNFFTWGGIRTFGYSPTLNLFVKRFYGGLVFTPIR